MSSLYAQDPTGPHRGVIIRILVVVWCVLKLRLQGTQNKIWTQDRLLVPDSSTWDHIRGLCAKLWPFEAVDRVAATLKTILDMSITRRYRQHQLST